MNISSLKLKKFIKLYYVLKRSETYPDYVVGPSCLVEPHVGCNLPYKNHLVKLKDETR